VGGEIAASAESNVAPVIIDFERLRNDDLYLSDSGESSNSTAAAATEPAFHPSQAQIDRITDKILGSTRDPTPLRNFNDEILGFTREPTPLQYFNDFSDRDIEKELNDVISKNRAISAHNAPPPLSPLPFNPDRPLLDLSQPTILSVPVASSAAIAGNPLDMSDILDALPAPLIPIPGSSSSSSCSVSVNRKRQPLNVPALDNKLKKKSRFNCK